MLMKDSNIYMKCSILQKGKRKKKEKKKERKKEKEQKQNIVTINFVGMFYTIDQGPIS